ncbi:MAG: Spermidine synthase, partial [uncultured Gemmatimonadetes bacterium]
APHAGGRLPRDGRRALHLRAPDRGVRAGVRAGGRGALQLPAGRQRDAVLHRHRHLPGRHGGGELAQPLRHPRHRGALRGHGAAAGRDRRLLVRRALPGLRVHGSLSLRPVRAGGGDRRACGAGDPAADAHPQGALRVQGRGGARPHLGLPGGAGRVAALSRRAGAGAGAGEVGHRVRHRERPGRALVHLPVPRRAGRAGGAAGGVSGRARAAVRGLRGGRAPDPRGRAQHLRGRDRLHPRLALPAHRADRVEERPAPLPQRPPPVLLARRVPLPRGAGAPGAGGAPRRPPRAGAGRRRRAGRARGAALPRRAGGDAGGPGPRDDAPVRHAPRAHGAQRQFPALAAGARGERRRLRVAGGDGRDVRLRGGGFPRSLQLRRRQAVHDGFLPPPGPAAEPRRALRGAEHVAHVRAARLLEHRRHPARRRLPHAPLPPLRAVVRRMGIRAGGARGVRGAHRAPVRPALPHSQRRPAALRLPRRHAAGARRRQPAGRPDPGAVLRPGLEGIRGL